MECAEIDYKRPNKIVFRMSCPSSTRLSFVCGPQTKKMEWVRVIQAAKGRNVEKDIERFQIAWSRFKASDEQVVQIGRQFQTDWAGVRTLDIDDPTLEPDALLNEFAQEWNHETKLMQALESSLDLRDTALDVLMTEVYAWIFSWFVETLIELQAVSSRPVSKFAASRRRGVGGPETATKTLIQAAAAAAGGPGDSPSAPSAPSSGGPGNTPPASGTPPPGWSNSLWNLWTSFTSFFDKFIAEPAGQALARQFMASETQRVNQQLLDRLTQKILQLQSEEKALAQTCAGATPQIPGNVQQSGLLARARIDCFRATQKQVEQANATLYDIPDVFLPNVTDVLYPGTRILNTAALSSAVLNRIGQFGSASGAPISTKTTPRRVSGIEIDVPFQLPTGPAVDVIQPDKATNVARLWMDASTAPLASTTNQSLASSNHTLVEQTLGQCINQAANVTPPALAPPVETLIANLTATVSPVATSSLATSLVGILSEPSEVVADFVTLLFHWDQQLQFSNIEPYRVRLETLRDVAAEAKSALLPLVQLRSWTSDDAAVQRRLQLWNQVLFAEYGVTPPSASLLPTTSGAEALEPRRCCIRFGRVKKYLLSAGAIVVRPLLAYINKPTLQEVVWTSTSVAARKLVILVLLPGVIQNMLPESLRRGVSVRLVILVVLYFFDAVIVPMLHDYVNLDLITLVAVIGGAALALVLSSIDLLPLNMFGSVEKEITLQQRRIAFSMAQNREFQGLFRRGVEGLLLAPSAVAEVELGAAKVSAALASQRASLLPRQGQETKTQRRQQPTWIERAHRVKQDRLIVVPIVSEEIRDVTRFWNDDLPRLRTRQQLSLPDPAQLPRDTVKWNRRTNTELPANLEQVRLEYWTDVLTFTKAKSESDVVAHIWIHPAAQYQRWCCAVAKIDEKNSITTLESANHVPLYLYHDNAALPGWTSDAQYQVQVATYQLGQTMAISSRFFMAGKNREFVFKLSDWLLFTIPALQFRTMIDTRKRSASKTLVRRSLFPEESKLRASSAQLTLLESKELLPVLDVHVFTEWVDDFMLQFDAALGSTENVHNRSNIQALVAKVLAQQYGLVAYLIVVATAQPIK